MTKKDKDFRKIVEIYKKEDCSFQTLGNTFTPPLTGKIVYKEHIAIKGSSKVSLTSSKKVRYYQIINGVSTKKSVDTNLLGSKINGKNQYGLMYKLNENHGMNFHETEKLNINILKNFGIFNKNILIPYTFRVGVAIKAQDQGNILFRGQSSYQTRFQINRQDSFINLHKKLSKMSDLKVYEYVKENTTIGEMFGIEQRYYSHFRNFNYYAKEEGEQVRKKEMQTYKESKMDNKDDLL